MCVSLGSTRHLWRDWMGSFWIPQGPFLRFSMVFPLQAFRRTRGRSILGLLPYGPYPTSSNIQPATFNTFHHLSIVFICFEIVHSSQRVPNVFALQLQRLRLVMGYRKRWALDASKLLRRLDAFGLWCSWGSMTTHSNTHPYSLHSQLHGTPFQLTRTAQCMQCAVWRVLCHRKWPPLGISTWARCARPGLRMHRSNRLHATSIVV